MKILDEEGAALDMGSCPRLGYYRVCGEKLVADEPYGSLGHYLRLLSGCLESRYCLNAVPASGRPGLPRRLNLKTLQRMLNIQFVDAGLGAGISSPLSLSLTQPYSSPAFRMGYYRGLFDLAAHSSGVTLALRGGPKGDRLYLPRYSDKRDRTHIPQALNHLPLIYLISFELVTAYHLIDKASFLLIPPSPKLCSKGFKIQCFLYQGGSGCIYSPGPDNPIKCPLRPITRKGRRTLGGAFQWLKRAQDKVNEARKHLPGLAHARLDLSLSCFIINHLARETLDLAVANARILGENPQPIIEYYAELGLGECNAPPPNNPRLSELFKVISETRDNRSLDNPYATRTEVVLSTEYLPYALLQMAELVEVSRFYKYCRPTTLRPSQKDSLRAYLIKEIPLLGKVAKDVVEAIAKALEEHGCVEVKDLDNIVSQEMARMILEYLSQRNILSRVSKGPYAVYNPTSHISELL